MRFPTVEYLEWTKTALTEDVNVIGASGVEPVTHDDLGIPAQTALTVDGAYGSEAARARLSEHLGLPPESIYPTEGTSLANFLALGALLGDGGTALVETPVYTPFSQQVAYFASEVRWLERRFSNRYAVHLDELRAAVTDGVQVIALTNLHNPSGVRMPDEALVEIAHAAARVGATVLVDEAYRDFIDDDDSVASAAELAPNIVSTASLTKAYGLGHVRFGWIAGPPALIERAGRINDYLGVLQPAPAVGVGLRALERLPSLRARRRALVDSCRPILRDWLEARADLECVWPTFGPIAFARLAGKNLDDGPLETTGMLETLLTNERVAVIPGQFFRDPRGLRLAATAKPLALERGLEALGRALDRYPALRGS